MPTFYVTRIKKKYIIFSVNFTAMHLFGLNWQLQEAESQPAFENGGGKAVPTQPSLVTALSAESGKDKNARPRQAEQTDLPQP